MDDSGYSGEARKSQERTTGLNLEHNMHKDEAFLHSTANGALCQAIRCAYLTASRGTADAKSAAVTLLEAYLAAQSPPSLRDGDPLRPHRSPYCLRARASGKSTEKCSRTCIHYYAEQCAIRALLTKSFKPSVQKPA